MKRVFLLLAITLSVGLVTFANDYIAIAKDGNVYDDASAKYITVNQNNDDVEVMTGMVFETFQHVPGWYKVEYSPGLHGFIPDQIAASNFVTVAPGTYDIKNYPGHKLSAVNDGNTWTATVNGKNFKGEKIQDIILFFDDNKIAYSLVDIGNGPIVISYDNSLTKFF